FFLTLFYGDFKERNREWIRLEGVNCTHLTHIFFLALTNFTDQKIDFTCQDMRTLEIDAVELFDGICGITRSHEYMVDLFNKFYITECLDEISKKAKNISPKISQIIRKRSDDICDVFSLRSKIRFFFNEKRTVVVHLFTDIHSVSTASLLCFVDEMEDSRSRNRSYEVDDFFDSFTVHNNRIGFNLLDLDGNFLVDSDENPVFISETMRLMYSNQFGNSRLFFSNESGGHGLAKGEVTSGAEFLDKPDLKLIGVKVKYNWALFDRYVHRVLD
ncbi:hypothetical protein PFISCL1PPCAC_20110, partial [Pristionchus fissidentatus]